MTVLKQSDFWQSGTVYRANKRYKNLVIYNNKFYLCITNHTSTNNFDDNKDKFVEISESVGGGLSGTWDMSIVAGAPPAHLNQVLGGTINGVDAPYILSPTIINDVLIVSTTDIFPNNGEIVFNNVYGQNPQWIYFGFVNKEATLSDINLILTSPNPLPTPSISVFALGAIARDNYILGYNFTTSSYNQVNDGLAHPSGQNIYVKYVETDTEYQLYAHAEGSSTYNLITTAAKTLAPNGIKPVLMAIYEASSGTPNNFTVSRFGLGEQNAQLPENNPVGKRYLITHNGFYHGEHGHAGDIAEFIAIDNVFFTTDSNLLETTSAMATAMSAIATSLQQQISAIHSPSAIKTELVATVTNGNVTQDMTHMTNSELLRITYDYTTLVNVNTVTLTQLNDVFVMNEYSDKHIDAFVLLSFPTQTLNNDNYTLNIICMQYGRNGSGSAVNGNYVFNLKNTKSLLFRYIDGILYPISRTTYDYYGIRQQPAIPAFSDHGSESVVFANNGDYKDCFTRSDTYRINVTASQTVNGVTLNLNPFTLIPSVMSSGVIISINTQPNADITNITIQDSTGNTSAISHTFLQTSTYGVLQFLWNPMSRTLIKLDNLIP